MSSNNSEISTKILMKSLVIGIIGQGYVGLPLAMAFAKKVKVIGFDVSEKTINLLKSGKSHIIDVTNETISQSLSEETYVPSSDSAMLAECDVIIICVPTPLGKDKIPDMSYIRSASATISKILHKGQYVVLESTTYPGTTEEVMLPILEEGSGLTAGKDFFVAFSPERIDPGNKQFTIDQVPKVVGGMNPDVTKVICEVYHLAIPQVVPVSSTQAAESVKMVENIFRHVNIALINELAQIFEKMDVNTWEVVAAAATKPYGFMPFYPGPGVGGHCIPLDPYYLSYKAKQYGSVSRFIEIAGEINDDMKIHTINLASKGLKTVGKKLYHAKVAVIGLSYKKDIDDVRESPSIGLLEELVNLGSKIVVYDPFAAHIHTATGDFASEKSLQDALNGSDCAIFMVDHSQFHSVDIVEMSRCMASPIIIDAKNLYEPHDGIIYLGIGKAHQNL